VSLHYSAFAPAKINLYLHITGKRADGYHLLDSLVVFADIHDKISVEASDSLKLEVRGKVLTGENSIIKAARLLARRYQVTKGAAIILDKYLPVGAGIGGGSSDAATALHLLCQLWELPLTEAELASIGLELGADVPVCLQAKASYMRGIGEQISPAFIPSLFMVLVNPNQPLLTKAVFSHFNANFSESLTPPSFASTEDFIAFLAARHNALQAPAMQIMPEIGVIVEAISSTQHCLLVRMSGSGATCFGLFRNKEEAEQAALALKQQYPHWWVETGSWKR